MRHENMASSTDSNVCDNYELIATAIRDQFQTGERGTKNLIGHLQPTTVATSAYNVILIFWHAVT